jgi:hypothetical protein
MNIIVLPKFENVDKNSSIKQSNAVFTFWLFMNVYKITFTTSYIGIQNSQSVNIKIIPTE